VSWDRHFNESIVLPDGSKLTTLGEAGKHILELSKAQHNTKELQKAVRSLIEAAEYGGEVMFAHIGMLRALSGRADEPSAKTAPVKLSDSTSMKPEPEHVPSIKPTFDRSPIASETLQSAITDAVKKAEPACEAFVGVIVEPTTPKSHFDANWALKGIKFGRSDREKANEAVMSIVERMQRQFRLSNE
jgi:hypothetical protein